MVMNYKLNRNGNPSQITLFSYFMPINLIKFQAVESLLTERYSTFRFGYFWVASKRVKETFLAYEVCKQNRSFVHKSNSVNSIRLWYWNTWSKWLPNLVGDNLIIVVNLEIWEMYLKKYLTSLSKVFKSNYQTIFCLGDTELGHLAELL